jgi:dihydroanticapsin dehydrogenase
MRLRLQGRAALVTGAAGGIGAATVRRLVREGSHVVAVDRDAAALAAAHGAASDVLAVAADVTDEDEVGAAVERAVDRFGGLDVVVSCAGISGPVGTLLPEVTAADWAAVFAVNVTGTFLVLRAAVPALRSSNAAAVVCVASDSALVTAPGMAPYAASKAAVVQLVRAAAVDLAPDGIRVTAVCPSIVDTAMSRGDLGLVAGFSAEPYPVQTPDEVAAQIAFLASPLARAVNGTALLSDFGYSARSTFPA